MLSKIQSKFGAFWCGMTHQSVMWPVHGHYECRTCGRHFPAFQEAPIREFQGPASADAASAALSRA